MNWRNTWLCGPGAHRRVIDEYEVGPRAAKVWAWGPHYCPPDQYARIRREQAAKALRRAEPAPLPVGQLDLFAEAS